MSMSPPKQNAKNNFFDHINTLILSITSAQTPNSIVMDEKRDTRQSLIKYRKKLIIELGRTTALYKKGDRAKAEELIKKLFFQLSTPPIYIWSS